jgi:Glyoxalase/Bleomycin resistance protein/Dioxygenase superfamily
LLRVADLDAAISFYGRKLGHRLLWRSHEAAGFALPETDAELVVHLHLGPETDILVDDVDEAFASFLLAGGVAIQPPFDIAIGRCARIRATRSATNWSYWINQKAGWLLTLMVELRVSSREINKCVLKGHRGHQEQCLARASNRGVASSTLDPRPSSASSSRPLPQDRNGSVRSSSTVSDCPRASSAGGCNC